MGNPAGNSAKKLADYLAGCSSNGTVAHLTPDDIAVALKHLRRALPALEFHLEAVGVDGIVSRLASGENIEMLRSTFTAAAALHPNHEIRVRRGDEILSTVDLALL